MQARTIGILITLGLSLGWQVAQAQGQKIYWADSDSDKIQRANVDGSDVEDIVPVTWPNPTGVAVDVLGGKVYWVSRGPTGSGKIQRADLSGANLEDILGTGAPISIALDPFQQKIYWTHSFDFASGISRADLDGSNVEKDLVFTSLDTPNAIALDLVHNKMYWTLVDHITNPIQRADLDGSNIEDLVTIGPDFPVGIALDVPRGKMYWANYGAKKIQRANLDGTDIEDLVATGSAGPNGIALDQQRRKMYWTIFEESKIQRANLDGTDVEDVVSVGLTSPVSVALEELPSGIPTVSQWGFVILACLLLAAGTVIVLRNRRMNFGILLLPLVFTSELAAQPARVPTQRVMVNIDSGVFSAEGPADGPRVVFSRTVAVDGAAWVRLHFASVQLSGSLAAGDASLIRITSLQDGAMQTMNATSLTHWGNSSAYFKGDKVLVEVLAYPSTGANRMVIDMVLVPIATEIAEGPGICGAIDDRTPSTDVRAGRLLWENNEGGGCFQSACTAFLFDARPRSFLSAGHCCRFDQVGCSFIPIVEFDVPLSEDDGTINPSAIEDQYPIDLTSVQYIDGGMGADWCYFGVFDNSETFLSPLEAQGASYRLAESVPMGDGSTSRVTGYGVDNDPLGSFGGRNRWSLTQQTHAGPYVNLSGTILEYTVDVQGGNSGSAIEQECRDLVYGIATHADCPDPPFNYGTAITHAPLQDALIPNSIDGGTLEPLGVCADCNDNGVSDTQDISGGTSQDCNINGIPDECDPNEDCQTNGIQDICDIAAGSSSDLNSNRIPDECESSLGACCTDVDACVVQLETCCTATGSTFLGDGTTCSPTGACCMGDGSCHVIRAECCTGGGGAYLGDGTTCSPEGSCCVSGLCDVTLEVCCIGASGSFVLGGMCDLAACCTDGTTCEDLSEPCCISLGGISGGSGSSCPGLPRDGACCLPGMSCQQINSACCETAGGTHKGALSNCGIDLPNDPYGACCLMNGNCIETFESCCPSEFFASQFNCSGGSGPPFVFCGP